MCDLTVCGDNGCFRHSSEWLQLVCRFCRQLDSHGRLRRDRRPPRDQEAQQADDQQRIYGALTVAPGQEGQDSQQEQRQECHAQYAA